MNELTFFNILLISWFAVALIILITLLFISAPYGRHARRGWGPTVNNKLGWITMEAPALIVFCGLFIVGDNRITISILILFSLWLLHYIHRVFIYPFRLSSKANRMPLIILISAFVFNIVNGYLNGRYIFTFSTGYSNEWLSDPRFIIGSLIFLMGFIINYQADNTLRNLRQPDEYCYRISNAGLFRWVSCPNYLGEILIWSGWAVATWSLPGLAFAVWTFSNLAPRARTHHLWYRKQFADYPPERKALLPKVW